MSGTFDPRALTVETLAKLLAASGSRFLAYTGAL